MSTNEHKCYRPHVTSFLSFYSGQTTEATKEELPVPFSTGEKRYQNEEAHIPTQ